MTKERYFLQPGFRGRCFTKVLKLAVALLLFAVVPGFAFGPTGHRVVGRIAENHLSPQAQRAVKEIMGGETLARVATWPDEIRSDPIFDSTAPWHYVTVEDGETYDSSTKDPKGDVIEAIGRFMLQLKDPAASKEDKVIAIRWLVHLIGDVHQPLHVGRGADRGGNSIEAIWFGEKTNIHAVWDEGLIESTKLSFSELAGFIDTVPDGQVRDWQNSTVADWARESVEYRARVYEVPDPAFSGSYKYAYKNGPLVEQRLVQAGVRLAGVLNTILSGDGSSDEKISLATLGGTLWAQSGLEYQGVSISAYRQAQMMLDQALTDKKWTALPEKEPQNPQQEKALAALPPAIILDADETILDNSSYQAWLIKENKTYTSISWNRWVASAGAKAIPGAKEFIDYARKQGVAIFYVTNRDYRGDLDENENNTIEANEKDRILEPYTIKNLRSVGLLPQKGISDEDSLLLKGEMKDWGSDKTTRRRLLAEKYRIILLLGDSIGDFTGYNFGDHYGSLYELDETTRLQELAKYSNRWAKSWIVLPNAMYGEWLPRNHQQRLDALDVWNGKLSGK